MIGDLIGDWLKGILIDGIMGNLSGLFNTVNTKVGEIASDVGRKSLPTWGRRRRTGTAAFLVCCNPCPKR